MCFLVELRLRHRCKIKKALATVILSSLYDPFSVKLPSIRARAYSTSEGMELVVFCISFYAKNRLGGYAGVERLEFSRAVDSRDAPLPLSRVGTDRLCWDQDPIDFEELVQY